MITSTSENLLSPFKSTPPSPTHTPGSNFVFLVFCLSVLTFCFFLRIHPPYPHLPKIPKHGQIWFKFTDTIMHFCPPLSKGLRCSMNLKDNCRDLDSFGYLFGNFSGSDFGSFVSNFQIFLVTTPLPPIFYSYKFIMDLIDNNRSIRQFLFPFW